MLLGILSDTHDRLDRTRRGGTLLREEGAEALIHCGDLTGPGIVAICGVLPLAFVLGNNDDDMAPTLQRAAEEVGATYLAWAGEIALAGKRIAITHGHLSTDVRRLLEAKPDYLLTGHTHWADDSMSGPTRRINPGALHRAAPYSVALLNLASDELRILTIP